jgi:hypothetical protein
MEPIRKKLAKEAVLSRNRTILETPEFAPSEHDESEASSSQSEAAADDEDDAFAWLESLAARQGAEEGTLLTTPEQRADTPPEWVYEETGKPAEAVETGSDTAEDSETLVSAEVPDWIQDMSRSGEDESVEFEAQAVPEPSDWFAELPAETIHC